MKTRSLLSVLLVMLVFALFAALWPASAQEQMPPPRRVLTMQVSAAPNEPPSFEPLAYTGILKVHSVGTVTGDLEGTIDQRITQVDPISIIPNNEILNTQDIATFFTIETDDGTIEGYFVGPFYFTEENFPDSTFHQHGQVLAVTAAYVDLYLADVLYEGHVDFERIDGELRGLGDSGTVTIASRFNVS